MGLDRIDTQDFFIPSSKGEDELKGGSTRLSSVALELLVLFDGKLNLGEVITRSGHDYNQTHATVQSLASEGFLEMSPGLIGDIDFSYFFGSAPAAPTAEAVAGAGAEADSGAQRLSLDGYYVSIARRAVDKKRAANAPAISVLAIEDELEMQRMLRFLLTEAGFAPRLAGNRNEIVAALRTVPSPDVILLDIMLPDADGFDILAKVKQHPSLKTIPVIMLTAKATREDVLRGLAGGADGYITKPFDHDILIAGVKAVLGLH